MKCIIHLALSVVLFVTLPRAIAQTCNHDSPRPDIYDFTPAERIEIRDLIIAYLIEHDGHENHTNNADHSNANFLPWHDDFIETVEEFGFCEKGFYKYVPLPSWNPIDPIPDEFMGDIAVVDPDIYTPPQEQDPASVASYSFTEFDPALSSAICNGDFWDGTRVSTGCANAIAFSDRLECEHDPVHGAVGGAMTDALLSAGTAIFFLWHAYLDDIYEVYLCKCSNDSEGSDDYYDGFNVTIDQQSSDGVNEIQAFNTASTTGTLVIASTDDKTYTAGKRVTLLPGFSTQYGANLVVSANACPRPGDQTPQSRMAQPNNPNVNSKGFVEINEPSTQQSNLQPTTLNQVLDIGIFPNPNSGQFTLTLPTKELATIVVTNMLGAVVLQKQTTVNTNQLNLTNFGKGIYLVEVHQGAQVYREKVVYR